MKPLDPKVSYLEAKAKAFEDIEFVVTYYALAKQIYDEKLAIMKLCEPVLIKWLKKYKGKLVIDGYTIRLIKKKTIRYHGMLYKDYIREVNFEAERAIRDTWREYTLADQKFRSAECTVKGYGKFLLPRLIHNGGIEVIGGFELRVVKKNTIRVRIVGPIEYAKYFMKPV